MSEVNLIETAVFGVDVNVPYPPTIEAINEAAKNPDAVYDMAINYHLYHVHLSALRRAVCAELEKVTDVKIQAKREIGESGREKVTYTEKFEEYVERLRGLEESGELEAGLVDKTITEVSGKVLPSFEKRARGGASKTELTKKARKFGEEAITLSEEDLTAAVAKLNGSKYNTKKLTISMADLAGMDDAEKVETIGLHWQYVQKEKKRILEAVDY